MWATWYKNKIGQRLSTKNARNRKRIIARDRWSKYLALTFRGEVGETNQEQEKINNLLAKFTRGDKSMEKI